MRCNGRRPLAPPSHRYIFCCFLLRHILCSFGQSLVRSNHSRTVSGLASIRVTGSLLDLALQSELKNATGRYRAAWLMIDLAPESERVVRRVRVISHLLVIQILGLDALCSSSMLGSSAVTLGERRLLSQLHTYIHALAFGNAGHTLPAINIVFFAIEPALSFGPRLSASSLAPRNRRAADQRCEKPRKHRFWR